MAPWQAAKLLSTCPTRFLKGWYMHMHMGSSRHMAIGNYEKGASGPAVRERILLLHNPSPRNIRRQGQTPHPTAPRFEPRCMQIRLNRHIRNSAHAARHAYGQRG